MPSTSKKQSIFMAAVAHNPAFAKKVGVSQSVGKDFNTADKGKKFKEGGAMKSDAKEDTKMDKAQDKAMIKKAFKQHDAQEHKGGKGTNLALKKGGMTKMAKGGGIESKGKTQGKMVKMNRGGRAC
jgi:CubicO group peptidase (beta-lactamase class C family)